MSNHTHAGPPRPPQYSDSGIWPAEKIYYHIAFCFRRLGDKLFRR